MKLYFNYTQNFILADCEGEVIDMRTASKWIPIKDLGDLYDMSDSDVTVSGSLITMSIDGHKVTARHKVSAGVNYVQLTGHFPRYFWKGFANLLTK